MKVGIGSQPVRKEGGQTAVEFAITLTVTMLLIFGLIDFSRAVYVVSVVKWAAQEGARAGIVDTNLIVPAVQSKLVGLNPDDVTVSYSKPSPKLVEVDVTYELSAITPLIAVFSGGAFELHSSASMLSQ